MKSLKDPFGQQFNYAYDKTGRLSSVAGTAAFDDITDYANAPKYNARGTLTELHYGNGVQFNVTGYNDKLQATGFEVKKGTSSYIKKQYQFYADGSLKFTDDQLDNVFDRSYTYDQLGRTVSAMAGAAARGETDTAANIPYRQSFVYNAFDNVTGSTMEHYASGQNSSTYTFTNNRNTQTSSVYDAEGNQTADEGGVYQFDAAGRAIKNEQRNPNYHTQFLPATHSYYDGAGQETKRVDQSVASSYGTSYFIRSSVTGKIVSEANSTGEKVKTFVSANGVTVAEQIWGWNGSARAEYVNFLHQDASGASLRTTNKSGFLNFSSSDAEFDARGNNVGLSNPYIPEEPEVDNPLGNI